MRKFIEFLADLVICVFVVALVLSASNPSSTDESNAYKENNGNLCYVMFGEAGELQSAFVPGETFEYQRGDQFHAQEYLAETGQYKGSLIVTDPANQFEFETYWTLMEDPGCPKE